MVAVVLPALLDTIDLNVIASSANSVVPTVVMVNVLSLIRVML